MILQQKSLSILSFMDKNEEEEVEDSLDLPETNEGEEDTTDWKAEAQNLQNKSIAQRERTKMLKEQLKSLKIEVESQPKSNELDTGQLAYLRADGIKGADEVTLFREVMTDTGKSFLDVLNGKYFQSELKGLRESKSVLEATPTGSKRGSTQASNSVDYHLAKYMASGKLPEDRDMREKVVNARYKQEKNKNEFTDNPVVGK